VTGLLADERARQARGTAARELARELYGWDRIAVRLLEIYEQAAGRVAVSA
jgi:glycosyltransferase involved in cell wall biosynthesis